MYIKNQSFSDEDTLLEMLFDFSLGDETPIISEHKANIEQDLLQNETFQNYLPTIKDEEERLEIETEERLIRLAEALMNQFEKFTVHNQKLFGLKNKEETLLYSIDLV
ncbi:MAG: hypothetical protein JST52_03460 [Bacteroidetes bacterium]|nr:hypothetical protein [Bacteroidota bacterium]MBS1738913.1 hypothetical protein [Bacteroidota bacterium]MBS1776574.1 hypothetical protein [Bacteroidota bacterium]